MVDLKLLNKLVMDNHLQACSSLIQFVCELFLSTATFMPWFLHLIGLARFMLEIDIAQY